MKNLFSYILILSSIGLLQSCRKFIQVDPPNSTLISETVFMEDKTAIATMSSVFGILNTDGFASGTLVSVTYASGLSSDEFQLFSTDLNQNQFFISGLAESNSTINVIWTSAYSAIYSSNAVIEGVRKSKTLSPAVRNQLEGEAKFVRAFSFFYLVNLFGDVPLSVTTDYRINAIMPKSPVSDVYKQIKMDLIDAQSLLLDDYSFSSNERVRPNKWVATALLSRVYLYLAEWAKAEEESGKIISNTAFFGLSPLKDVFLKNSTETIWQLNNNALNTNESATFTFSTKPTSASLADTLYKSFQSADQRRANWILPKISAGITYYQLNKYKAPKNPPVTNPVTVPVEYSSVFRLSEQFLIRAEARAQQGKVIGLNSAESDINVIRSRAGVGAINASSKESMILAIENERKLELFGEWGHRWLDLKRTKRANILLSPIKGSNWSTDDQLYPIPIDQIRKNPGMKDAQNPGYN